MFKLGEGTVSSLGVVALSSTVTILIVQIFVVYVYILSCFGALRRGSIRSPIQCLTLPSHVHAIKNKIV